MIECSWLPAYYQGVLKIISMVMLAFEAKYVQLLMY